MKKVVIDKETKTVTMDTPAEVVNPNRVILVYKGVRVSGDKRYFHYYYPDTEESISFDKKIVSYEMVGSMFEVERTGAGVKGPYKPIKPYNVQPEQKELYEKVLEWSINDRCAKEEFNAMSITRRGSDGNIDSLIDKVISILKWKSKVDKARIARYVYEKLINS